MFDGIMVCNVLHKNQSQKIETMSKNWQCMNEWWLVMYYIILNPSYKNIILSDEMVSRRNDLVMYVCIKILSYKNMASLDKTMSETWLCIAKWWLVMYYIIMIASFEKHFVRWNVITYVETIILLRITKLYGITDDVRQNDIEKENIKTQYVHEQVLLFMCFIQ
jgi:hypothetical protein